MALVALLAACSADFKSGQTKCSPIDRTCPSGFTCAPSGFCVSGVNVDPAGTGGNAGRGGAGGSDLDAGTGTGGMMMEPKVDAETGTGGVPGTGGTRGTGGSGGPDAGPPPPMACADPKFPVACPALYDVPANCYAPGTDCTTVRHCFGQGPATACKVGFENNCYYRNCIRKEACPTGTKLCPGNDTLEIGPICLPMAADCDSLTMCPADEALHFCNPGQWWSCQAKACVPLTTECPMVKEPLLCPARGNVKAVCGSPYDDCSTALMCGEDVWLAPSGETVSCQNSNFSPADNKCPTFRFPSRTKLCPAMPGRGPECFEPNMDCAQRAVCNDVFSICPIGTKNDCQYPNCVVSQCPVVGYPQFTKLCPALNGVGASCQREEIDCSTVVYCPTEDTIGRCPTGKKWDCPTSKCI